ncbi:hypothetical protein HMPREF0653_01482, partial [Prevotella disiens JCM 6334 = ATCC 29426]
NVYRNFRIRQVDFFFFIEHFIVLSISYCCKAIANEGKKMYFQFAECNYGLCKDSDLIL